MNDPLRLWAQGGDGSAGFNAKFFTTSAPTDPTTLLAFLAGIVTLIFLVIFGAYRFQKWKRYKEFETEMKSLDLGTQMEGTFAEMVRRYSMDEPVNILYSPRLFDEMASTEMVRVLGSAGSVKAKQEFIDTVYKIRIKTYHPDWHGEMAEKKAEAGSLN
ncbi:MAG: hypothetical protein GC154_03460 [bacterium]|nr:hypothetical protein [bacterium]